MALPFANQAAQIKRPIKTALHQAVLDCRIHQVRLLVNKHGGNVDCKDMFGRTALMLACLLENEDDGYRMIKIFLKAGAYVNIRDNMRRTALHYACMKGKSRIVERLLREESVSVNAPDNDGNTPLIHASLSAKPEMVEILVDVINRFGLSMDERNCMGYTALLLACKYGHCVSAHTLLKRGLASPSLRDNEFFLNAMEWVSRSSALQAVYSNQSKGFAEIPRFTREKTMYRAPSGHVCHHFKTPTHPLGESLDSALRLPAVFSYFPPNRPQEIVMDGVSARSILIKEIDDAVKKPKHRPTSRVSTRISHSGFSSTKSTRSRFASTPKLLALTARSHTTMVPDMRTLFNLYSDQHQDKVGRGTVSAPPGGLRPGKGNKPTFAQVHFELTTPSVAGSIEA